MKSNDFAKRLYVVATPIGHLGDMSARAIDVLRRADVVLCETPEHSMRLLQHFGIAAKTVKKLTDHDSDAVIHRYLSEKATEWVVISDAGTPLISDPGKRLIEQAWRMGFAVMSVPGPCAVIAALSICPLLSTPFRFLGFLPRKSGERRQYWQALCEVTDTLVFYESPHRLQSSLQDLGDGLGEDRHVFVVKEMTKRFECVWQGALSVVLAQLAEANLQGEFVVVVQGASEKVLSTDMDGEVLVLSEVVDAMLEAGLSPTRIKSALSDKVSVRKNQLYQWILARDAARK